MAALTIFAMTKKGLAVVEEVQRLFPGLIAAVVSSRDAAISDDCYTAIRQLCESRGIAFFDRGESERIATTAFALAVSWRWLIDMPPPARLIVLHDSLLPRYRGFNPLVTALINGDAEVGVTAIYASRDYDAGDIITRSVIPVQYPAKIREVTSQIGRCYVDVAVEVCSYLTRELAPPATAQDDSKASYSLWRDDEDYFIDWSQPAPRIKRVVDALGSPYRGAACWVDGEVVARIVDVEVVDDVAIANREPGKIIFVANSKPIVVCGEGLLRVDAMVDDAGTSMLPLKRFRTRLSRRKPNS